MRLDLALFERGLARSRTDAKALITEGAVKVDGSQVLKASFETSDDAVIEVKAEIRRYVSRGGLKLEAALDEFKINPAGRMCIDVGASSGGFTDCLLQRGAVSVAAVDSGSGQMVQTLRDDMRVQVVENYNARYIKREDFDGLFSLAVMDVSFISATYIIEGLRSVLTEGADFVCLVKPQFEVGRALVGKGGIVKDEKVRLSAVKKVIDFAESNGFSAHGYIKSPIKGGDGNTEFLVHFKAR